MTPPSIEAADWLAAERKALSRVRLAAEAQSVGRVEEIADGVARVSGLPEARLGELLRFEGGRIGYALSLEPETINAASRPNGGRPPASRSPARNRLP